MQFPLTQVTAAVLFNLQKEAYQAYASAKDDPETLEVWRRNKCQLIPQFNYWDTVFRLQLTVLQLVQSLRSANFALYKHSLKAIVLWCFALNHVHYA